VSREHAQDSPREFEFDIDHASRFLPLETDIVPPHAAYGELRQHGIPVSGVFAS
jgi:hypothetical protein